jgi:peptide/nickel transport system substrate-binding protein
MRKVFLLGLAAVVLVAFSFVYVETCQSKETTKGPKGDLVVLVPSLWNEVWGLDVGSSGDRRAVLIQTNETLVRRALEGEPTGISPGLAERWVVSEDGLTYDFYLRKGIQFNEGYGEVTAEDVKFSWELVGKAGSTHDKATLFRIGKGGQTESITIIDKYHIRIKLVKPEVVLLTEWLSAMQFLIVSKNHYEKVGHDAAIRHPVGTGPWVLIEHEPGDYVKFEAVENHYRQTPAFKYLTIRAIPEASTRLAMIKTGKAHIDSLPPEYAAEVEKAGYWIKRVPGALNVWVAIGGNILPTRKYYDPTVPWVTHQDEPADSEWNQRALKVRQALNLAVNRQAMIDKIFMGYGEMTPLRHWYSFGTVWCRPEWKPVPYDPEKAKRLLAEAGYPDGFEFTLVSYPSVKSPKNLEIGGALAMDWEKIGLTVKREITEFSVFRPKMLARNYPWTIYASASDIRTEPWETYTYLFKTTGLFSSGYESYELDKLIEKCETTLNFDERLEYALQLGDHWIKGGWGLGILNTDSLFAVSPKIKEWPITPLSVVPQDYEYITLAD